MSFVLDSLYLSPGKNIPKEKQKSVINIGSYLDRAVVCSYVATSEMCINHVSLFKYNVEYQY